MFKVTKKPLTPNIIWDAEKNAPMCKFVKGVFETNDKDLADKLQEMGHTVSGEADAAPEPKTDGDDQGNGTPDPDATPEGDDSDAPDNEQGSGEADAAPRTNRRSRK